MTAISDADAAIIGGAVGGFIGGLLGLAGVWVASYLERRASEKRLHSEKLLAIYRETELLRNLLIAFQKNMITQSLFYRRWNHTTERIMLALVGSGLNYNDKKRLLKAINMKWDDGQSVSSLEILTDDLLEKFDPEYARAARELLDELGVKRDEIDPVILGGDS